jgi:hypothetical protein
MDKVAMLRLYICRHRLVSPETSKHRIFRWLPKSELPEHSLIVIAKDDDTTFGILQSRVQVAWVLSHGNWLGVGNDLRYNSTRTFQTFPFPDGLTPNIPAASYATDPRAIKIADAAKHLNCRATRQSGPLTTRGIGPPRKVGEEGIFMEEVRLSPSAPRASGSRRDVMVEPDEVTAMLRLKQLGWCSVIFNPYLSELPASGFKMSIDTVSSLEMQTPASDAGGVAARQGFKYQDHVAAFFVLAMIDDERLLRVECESADDARAADAFVNFQPELAQLGGDEGGSLLFLIGQFRMSMQMPAPTDEFGCEAVDARSYIHRWSLVQRDFLWRPGDEALF